MYTLDINFLKDRAPAPKNDGTRIKKAPMSPGDLTPLYIGGAVAAFTLALVGTGWWFLQSQNEH
jgi:type IV pilus assembly protein PilN